MSAYTRRRWVSPIRIERRWDAHQRQHTIRINLRWPTYRPRVGSCAVNVKIDTTKFREQMAEASAAVAAMTVDDAKAQRPRWLTPPPYATYREPPAD